MISLPLGRWHTVAFRCRREHPTVTAVHEERTDGSQQLKRGEQLVKEVPFVESRAEELGGQDVDQAVVTSDEFGRWAISLTFTRKGAEAFRRTAAENVGGRLAIVVEGEVYGTPVIREGVTG